MQHVRHLGERKDAFNKWDEKIKKEVGGKVGVCGRRRGQRSGGGGGGNEPRGNKNPWDETKQIFHAFTNLVTLVNDLSITSNVHSFHFMHLHHCSRCLLVLFMFL